MNNNEQNNNSFTKIGVIGLGFVGLPLALLFINKGFTVTGIDLDTRKIDAISNSTSYIEDITNENIITALKTERFSITNNYHCVNNLDVIIICVPTPLTSYHTPDLSYIQNVSISLLPHLRKGQLVILESSTYPGTTREVLKPILEKSGLEIGSDIFLSYSPERVDPGNKQFKIEEIPKIVSGVSESCKKKIVDLYQKVFTNVVAVTTTEVAEFCKLLENSFRFVNISFMNEIAVLCDSLNINIWEVIEAAKTKPYGFMPFYPGPGIGGHCIPVDPIYLSWKAMQAGHTLDFLSISDQMNTHMIEHILSQIKKHLSVSSFRNRKIVLYGLAYKKDISDYRESPSLALMKKLIEMGANVTYHDPFIPTITINKLPYSSIELTKDSLSKIDCFVILTDHSTIPLDLIINHAPFIYDSRNVTKNYHHRKIVRLGEGAI